MRMKEKVLSLSIVAILLLCVSCGSKNTTQAVEGRILNAKDNGWQGTDMYQCDEWTDFQSIIADTVLTKDPFTGQLQPGIASAWGYSDDGLTLRLTFPEGMRFANGEPLGPEDFVASIEYGRDGVYAEGYENIESMEVAGRDVVCHLSEYSSDLEYFLTACFVGIISRKQLETMSKEELLWGALPYGPFYVDDYVQGSRVMLKPNPYYKTYNPLIENPGAPYLGGINVNITDMEDFTIVTSLKEGVFDYVAGANADVHKELRGTPGITVAQATFPNVEFIEINNRNKFLSDQRVRLALFLLVDRNSFQEMAGNDLIPAYTLVVNTVFNYSKEAEDYFKANYANNPQRAKQLLEEAGYRIGNSGYYEKNGEVLELSFLVRTSGMSVIAGQDLQIQLKDAGIRLTLETLDWEYRSERVRNGNYDLSISSLGWGEPILLLNNFRTGPGSIANEEEYNRQVVRCARTVDYEERTGRVKDLLVGIFDDLNCMPIYSEITYVAYGPGAEGVKVYPNATIFMNEVK